MNIFYKLLFLLVRAEILIYCMMFVAISSFLSDKYIFSIDYSPIINNYHVLEIFYGRFPPIYGGYLFLEIISVLIHPGIFQEILLTMILFLSYYSIYSFTKAIGMSKNAQIFAQIVYVFNPFVYIRVIQSQLFFLFSYSIVPFFLKTFIDLLKTKDNKEMIKLIFLLSLVAFNIHILIISLIIMSVFFLLWFNKTRDIKISKIIILSAVLFTLLNLYWIIPELTAKDTVLDDINDEHFKVYAPKIENILDLFNIASMYGFWREGYIYAKDFIPYWQVLLLFIIYLSIEGFISYYRHPKIGIYTRALGIIGILGFILATGINGPFGGFNHWLFENTIFKGFRDSHKFVAMLVLSYAILGGLGLSKFEAMSEKKKYLKAIIVIALIIPFIYSFTFFNGFAGHIKPTDYPADWYEVNDLLKQDGQDFKILFFPWHGYMDFNWVNNTDKRIANPSRHFFDKEVISATNAEIGNIYRQNYPPDQLYIDSLLEIKDNITNFGELVSILNVKYIILAKEIDYKKYYFLFNQSDLELIRDTDTLYIFKNTNSVSKIYQTDDIENIADKEEVGYIAINPVRFEIADSNRKYLVFTEPYSKDWKFDGKEPVKAYGVVNAFENGGKEIRFERFYRINLPAYLISFITFIGLIAVYPGLGKRKSTK